MTDQQTIDILKEMRDRQKESLDLQREQFEFIKAHYDRAEAIQDKAEKLQDRATGAMKIVIPLIAVALFMLLGIIVIGYL